MEFTQIALLLAGASLMGTLALVFHQPLISGYIIAGALLSRFNLVLDSAAFESLGKIGIALLLFLLGLEMNPKEISSVGKTVIGASIGQIISTFLASILLCLILGMGYSASVFISVALTFSSTIIVVRLLSEKKDLRSLYGRISVGILLVQDFAAILILMFLSGLGGSAQGTLGYILIFLKAAFLYFAVWVLSKKILPRFMDRVIGKSGELTFIFSIAWAVGVSAFTLNILGFSLEIGGFLAGLSLSGTTEHLQIASRTKPLRDFFLTIFFLLLGSRLGITSEIWKAFPYALLLSVFVVFVKPAIVMALMGNLGYKKRTSFLVGLSNSQISEFSLIIVGLGLQAGHINQMQFSMITLVGVLSMTISTYMILGAGKLYQRVSKYLGFFEKKVTSEGALTTKTSLKNHIVLVGCDRTGKHILKYLKNKFQDSFIVVDFNPVIFSYLDSEKVPVVFGDAEDPEIMDAANIKESKFIISTTSDLQSNLSILSYLKKESLQIPTVFTATLKSEALRLYEAGASYVVIPEMVAGDHVRQLIKNCFSAPSKVKDAGKVQFERLLERLKN